MATIPSLSNNYTNPQGLLQQSFLDYSKIREQNRLAGLDRSLSSVAQWLKSEKASQKALVEKQNQTQLEMYNKVEGLPRFSVDFNTRQEQFWDSRVDKYLEIKNQIETGDIGAREGNKKLARINRQLESYKAISPKVLALAQELKDHIKIQPGKTGAVSSLVPTTTQQILLNLLDGGDVGLVEDENTGVLMLYQEGVGSINLNELALAEDKEANSFLKYVPEFDEFLTTASKGTFGDYDNGTFIDELVTIKQVTRGNKEVTLRIIDEKQKAKGYQHIIDNELLQPLIDNYSDMSVIWNDVIPNEIYDEEGNLIWTKGKYKDTAWHDPAGLDTDQSSTFIAEQNRLATEFLAKKAVEDYIKEGGMSEGRVTGTTFEQKEKPEMNERNARRYFNVFNFTGKDVVKDLNNALATDEIASAAEVISGAAYNQKAQQAHQQKLQSLPQGATATPPPLLKADHLYVPLGEDQYRDLGKKATTKKGAFKQLLKVMGYSDALVNDIVAKYRFN